MALGDERELPVPEPVHEPELPQRLRAIQRLGEEPAGEVLQLLLGSGLRQARVTEVVAEVEVRVVDPDRAALVQRDLGEALAKARDEVQPRLDVDAQLVPGRRGALEDRHRRDVEALARLLEVQERGVEGGDAVAVGHARR